MNSNYQKKASVGLALGAFLILFTTFLVFYLNQPFQLFFALPAISLLYGSAYYVKAKGYPFVYAIIILALPVGPFLLMALKDRNSTGAEEQRVPVDDKP